MAFQRWTLWDPNTDETYTFPQNPKEGGAFGVEKQAGYMQTCAPDGRVIRYEGQDRPKATTAKGVVRSVAQRDELIYWAEKRTQVLLTNDFGEQDWIYIDKLNLTRKHVVNIPYKADYDLAYARVDIPG